MTEDSMNKFFKTLSKENTESHSTDVKSSTSLPKGIVSTKVYGDYYDVSHTITTAGASNPNDFDSSVYNREEIFKDKERRAENLLVINDGPDTLFLVVTHIGGLSYSQEVPIYAGEAKTYYNVYELRLRSPTAGNAYRVMEYNLCCDASTPQFSRISTQIQDWTAVAQNTIVKSSEFDFTKASDGLLNIQAALDTETAHLGTRFIVQISTTSSGNEDWYNLTEFIGLTGTANSEALTNNPASIGTTVLTCANTTGYTVLGNWRFIKDATLLDSELIFQIAVTTNTNITILDGTTNAHIQNTLMYNIALTQNITIPKSIYRLRVVVDNTYSPSGSTLNYKVNIVTSV